MKIGNNIMQQQTLPFKIAEDATTPRLGVMRSGPPETVAALDIGSSKLTCIIAQTQRDQLKIVSLATEPSRGIERGELTDMQEAAQAVAAVISKAQAAAYVEHYNYFVGVGSKRAQGRNSRGSVSVTRESREITPKNVQQALRAARTISLPPDRQILDGVPQSFAVDDITGIRNPVGMTGSRLDAEVYLATESINCIRNVTSCLRSINCKTEGILFEPFATAEAVLTADERKLGSVQIDIGGGTTDIVVYYANAPRFVRVLPIGGEHIIRDVAVGLSATIEGARKLVHERGTACDVLVDAREEIEVETAGGMMMHKSTLGELCYIIECRIEEIFDIAQKEVSRAGLTGHCGGGVVVTGGVAHIKGIAKKAEQVFGTAARVGKPKIYTDDPAICENPEYATAVGLLVYGLRMRRIVNKEARNPILSAAARSVSWIKEFF